MFHGRNIGCRIYVPIGGRSFYAPDVSGAFQLDGNLEKLPHRMWPLNPRDPRSQIAALRTLRQLKRDPGVFRQVMLRGVPAPIEVQCQRGSALLEWLAQKIDTANDQRNRLRDSFAAPALCAPWLESTSCTTILLATCERIALSCARVERWGRPGQNLKKASSAGCIRTRRTIANGRESAKTLLTTSSFSLTPTLVASPPPWWSAYQDSALACTASGPFGSASITFW